MLMHILLTMFLSGICGLMLAQAVTNDKCREYPVITWGLCLMFALAGGAVAAAIVLGGVS